MVQFLHTFHPQPIIFSLGPITIYWYGVFIVLGILSALAVTFRLAKYYEVSRDTLFDLTFWLIIGGLIGARLYDVCLQLPFYLQHPWQILQIWKGGLAIHGSIIAGLLIIWGFARKYKLNFWQLMSLIIPGLSFAQAIGRWGNYFNQELFGLPTDLPWGIPIDLMNRPAAFITSGHFQPTFLYESIGCLLIGAILIYLNARAIKRGRLNTRFYIVATALYMILYSILRFCLEFIRLDETPYLAGLRWPQIISLIIILFSALIIFNTHAPERKNQS